MKSSVIVLTVSLALASSAFAVPATEVAKDKSGAVVKAACYHGSDYSTGWAGKCEDYCAPYGGFAFMTDNGCPWIGISINSHLSNHTQSTCVFYDEFGRGIGRLFISAA
ncbi:hypothetical protein BGZ83_006548 [Gryganskiella cystojenkinii]|nr:hypothetical protein BGZ83_006548 [Gryganskiella cystojenkinii]